MKLIKSLIKLFHPCKINVLAIKAAIDANLSTVGLLFIALSYNLENTNNLS
jgi:hypothetical protein